MKKIVFFLFFGVQLCSALGQVSFGGEPSRWLDKTLNDQIPFIETDPIDMNYLSMEDAITDQDKRLPYRFGVEFDVQYGLSDGIWEVDAENGLAIWQLGVACPGARSMNFVLSKYRLVKGSSLFIWSADRTEFIGSFNEKNNNADNVLGTTVLSTDRVVLELVVPIELMGVVELEIGKIVHGYRPVLMSHFDEQRGPYGSSGSCNNNVNCPVGADWQVEKRSVALILDGGFAACTGALVNNTANDGTPYFLTANHCYGNTTSSWVFVFNHETAGCTGNTGPTNQTVSGCVLRAKNAGSDFCLVELNSVPPAGYNVQYAGWDASDANTVSSATCIHHPSGDLKKISFENDPVSQGTWSGAQTWDVAQWDDGITEPGSSGSPLFDQNHRIIGQLYGGGSACSGSVENGQGDSYGRFGVSWDAGSSAASRLKEWLDPGNSGILVLDGYPDGFTPLALDAGATAISGLEASTCNASANPIVTLLNQGSNTLNSCTIQYQLNGGTLNSFPWTGALAQGQSININLPAITLTTGSNTLVVNVVNPNNGTDENNANNSVSWITNLIDVGTASAIPYLNNLSSNAFPYVGWQLNNPDGDVTWAQTTVTNGGGVLKYDCYNYDADGEEDDFITSPFALTNFTSFSLKFKVAHRRYSGTYTDGLKVSVSTDCDGPWSQVYFKEGATLATGNNSLLDFVDPTATEWRQECVELGSYASSNVLLKFTGINGYGNNIYVDDIQVVNTNCQGTVGIGDTSEGSMVVYPNPTQDQSVLHLSGFAPGNALLKVRNYLGQVMYEELLQISSFGNDISLNALRFPNGLYTIELKSVDAVHVLKWEVRR